MFYFICTLQAAIFIFLATKWNQIMIFWYKMEKPFLTAPYKMSGISLSLKIKIIAFTLAICCLTEHLFFIGIQLQFNFYQLKVRFRIWSIHFTQSWAGINFFLFQICNVSKISFLNNYMRRERPHLLDVLPYRWYIFPIFQWTITLMTFSRTYVDFFIIILSLGISTRFGQLNDRLRRTTTCKMDQKFWLEIRLHHTNLFDLLEYVNERISLLILISMSHNLFLICTKVFEAIK